MFVYTVQCTDSYWSYLTHAFLQVFRCLCNIRIVEQCFIISFCLSLPFSLSLCLILLFSLLFLNKIFSATPSMCILLHTKRISIIIYCFVSSSLPWSYTKIEFFFFFYTWIVLALYRIHSSSVALITIFSLHSNWNTFNGCKMSFLPLNLVLLLFLLLVSIAQLRKFILLQSRSHTFLIPHFRLTIAHKQFSGK